MGNYREKFNRVVGIVSEFDPFHLGHRFLLEQVRARFPGCGVVCVMSGAFTQRGSAAAVSKHARAEMALAGGADLVLELPVLWAAAPAETFARGGVQCLLDTGVVDTLAFGSEDGSLSRLSAAAALLEGADYPALLRRGLGEGLSFAAARQRAVSALDPDAGACLSGANNNLGVEYLRALGALGGGLEPVTIPRRGEGHGSLAASGPVVSASRLRAWMEAGEWDRLAPCLPPESLRIVLEQRDLGCCPARLERCQGGILARLRSMEPEELAALPGWEPGLEHRLARAAQEATTLAQLYDRAKTRHCPEARVRRMVLWAFLNLREGQRPEGVPYLRVLGCGPRGRSLLRAMKAQAKLPLLTRPGQMRRLEEQGQRVFRLEARATDLWRLCLPEEGQRRGGTEWRTGPVIAGQAE